MADYFIGDLQGCFDGLERALAEVQFNPGRDTLWLTGDLIARGEGSLETLEYCSQHESAIRTVLGNHDLHFLAVANKLKRDNPKDNLAPLLSSARLKYYLDWLRQQPMLMPLPDSSGFMSHAGLPPHWSIDDAQLWASELEAHLKKDNYTQLLAQMYGNTVNYWPELNTHTDKLIYTINGFTRMRYCDQQGYLDYAEKNHPKALAETSHLMPWFEFGKERFVDINWVFGHWAALMGETNQPNLFALDTGYVWGNHLTILEWKSKAIKKIPADPAL